MDLRRLRMGEWISGAAGLALTISLFLPWYSTAGVLPYVQGESVDPSRTGWQALGAIDVVLLVAALFGVAVFVLTAVHPTPAVPLALASLALLVAVIALGLTLLRLVDPPGGAVLDTVSSPVGGLAVEPSSLTITRETGLYLALVSSLGLVAGAFLAMWDERAPRVQRRPAVRVVEPPEPEASSS